MATIAIVLVIAALFVGWKLRSRTWSKEELRQDRHL